VSLIALTCSRKGSDLLCAKKLPGFVHYLLLSNAHAATKKGHQMEDYGGSSYGKHPWTRILKATNKYLPGNQLAIS